MTYGGGSQDLEVSKRNSRERNMVQEKWTLEFGGIL
jgi:hypothetical protein